MDSWGFFSICDILNRLLKRFEIRKKFGYKKILNGLLRRFGIRKKFGYKKILIKLFGKFERFHILVIYDVKLI